MMMITIFSLIFKLWQLEVVIIV